MQFMSKASFLTAASGVVEIALNSNIVINTNDDIHIQWHFSVERPAS
jgi:hypothetical protein